MTKWHSVYVLSLLLVSHGVMTYSAFFVFNEQKVAYLV